MIGIAPQPSRVAQELTGRDYLSYSALNTYRQCPLKYYFKYVAGLPEETVSSSLLFGGALHAAVEFHYRELLAGKLPPDLDTLLGVFWDDWQQRAGENMEIRFGKGESPDSIGHLADRMLRTFREHSLAQPAGHILGVEEEFRGPIVDGCPDLLARVDLLLETDGALVVRDFKTSRSRWSEAQVTASAEQLLLYGELAGRLVPEKSLRLEFAVLTKTKTPDFDLHWFNSPPAQVARTKRVVQRVWHAITAGHFYPAPSAMNCPSCPFREPCREWEG